MTPIFERGHEPKAVTVKEAAKLLSIGRSLMWSKIYDGTIKSIKLGNRVIVPIWAIDELLESDELSGATRAVPG